MRLTEPSRWNQENLVKPDPESLITLNLRRRKKACENDSQSRSRLRNTDSDNGSRSSSASVTGSTKIWKAPMLLSRILSKNWSKCRAVQYEVTAAASCFPIFLLSLTRE